MPSLQSLLRRIDFVTLRLFVSVCREEHLTRAAELENIAPSALSKRIAELEDIAGAALFQRQPRGMIPTAAGMALLRHAEGLIAGVERMGAELAGHAEGRLGEVRLLANISAIVEFLPDDLADFYANHPKMRIFLEERTSAAVIRGIEEGVADLGLCVSSMDSRALHAFPYRCDRLVLVVRGDHPYAGRSEIAFAETLDYEHIGLHQDSAIYRRSEVAAAMAGREVKLRIHVPGFDAVCRMVESGIGIGIIPGRVLDVIAKGLFLKAVPLTDEWADRELKLVCRDPAEHSPAVRLMREHLLAAAPATPFR